MKLKDDASPPLEKQGNPSSLAGDDLFAAQGKLGKETEKKRKGKERKCTWRVCLEWSLHPAFSSECSSSLENHRGRYPGQTWSWAQGCPLVLVQGQPESRLPESEEQRDKFFREDSQGSCRAKENLGSSCVPREFRGTSFTARHGSVLCLFTTEKILKAGRTVQF